MGQLAQCTRDIHINAQRAASEPLFEDLFPGPGVSYNRNKSILMHTSLQFRLHHDPNRPAELSAVGGLVYGPPGHQNRLANDSATHPLWQLIARSPRRASYRNPAVTRIRPTI